MTKLFCDVCNIIITDKKQSSRITVEKIMEKDINSSRVEEYIESFDVCANCRNNIYILFKKS